MKPAGTRYTHIAIWLHWIIALLLLLQYGIGPLMTRLPDSEISLTFSLYQLHKSIGITVLLLMIARVVWRLSHKPPAPLKSLSKAAMQAAATAHFLLYILTIVLCLLGWALVSASPYNIPTLLFGKVVWPHIEYFTSLTDKATAEASLKTLHAYGAYILLTLASLHAAAALRHHFLLKDTLLTRMRPVWRHPKPSETNEC